jgi:hypothetical protein
MTPEEIQQTADLLSKLEPGFLPYPVFEQVARLVALPIIEVIPLRKSPDGQAEVLLIERPDDDPLFAGALHTPGTVIRATDVHKPGMHNWPAFERVIQEELKGTEVSPPQYVGSMFHASKRGAEQAQLYWVEVKSEPKVGRFYDVNNLPSELIESQRDFITLAVKDFLTHTAD